MRTADVEYLLAIQGCLLLLRVVPTVVSRVVLRTVVVESSTLVEISFRATASSRGRVSSLLLLAYVVMTMGY